MNAWIPFLTALIWPATIFVLLVLYHREASVLIRLVRERLQRGDKFTWAGISIESTNPNVGVQSILTSEPTPSTARRSLPLFEILEKSHMPPHQFWLQTEAAYADKSLAQTAEGLLQLVAPAFKRRLTPASRSERRNGYLVRLPVLIAFKAVYPFLSRAFM